MYCASFISSASDLQKRLYRVELVRVGELWHILRECLVVRGWDDLPLDNWDVINLRDTIFPFRYLEVQDYQ